MVGESEEMRLMNPIDAVSVAEANRDLIVGIKVRVGLHASGTSGVVPLDIALEVAEQVGMLLMAHIDHPPPSYEDRAEASLHQGASVGGAGAGTRGRPQPDDPEGRRAEPNQSTQRCRFHTRCPFVFDRCRTEEPELRSTGSGQWAACHLEALPEKPGPAR
jgi:predicted amidohydrolase